MLTKHPPAPIARYDKNNKCVFVSYGFDNGTIDVKTRFPKDFILKAPPDPTAWSPDLMWFLQHHKMISVPSRDTLQWLQSYYHRDICGFINDLYTCYDTAWLKVGRAKPRRQSYPGYDMGEIRTAAPILYIWIGHQLKSDTPDRNLDVMLDACDLNPDDKNIRRILTLSAIEKVYNFNLKIGDETEPAEDYFYRRFIGNKSGTLPRLNGLNRIKSGNNRLLQKIFDHLKRDI